MQAIAKDKDYSRRVLADGPKEISTLAAHFNDLLQTTQEWQTEIITHRENLESLVATRTAQWQSAARTLEKELEERERTEAELRAKSAELAQTTDHLAHALQTEKRFLATMSHEIRTPLNAIIGFSHFTLQTELSSKQCEYLNKINIAGKSLLTIIEDILDFSKIDAGKLEIQTVPYRLQEVVNDSIDIISHTLHQKGLHFDLSIAAGLPSLLEGDPCRIRQILVNLLGNAVKFTEKGEIKLAIKESDREGDRITLFFSVQDTGIGMTPEHIARLFTPFTQADGSTTRKFGGTGLGLSISKRLIELMGGTIHVESAPSIGSTFSCVLPQRVVPMGVPEAIPEVERTGGGLGLERFDGYRVLVVEDNDFNRQIAQELLESWGFAVTTAVNGNEAVRLLTSAPPSTYDLVFMDVHMPEMDGLTAVQLIRGDPRFQALPILAMTASAFPEDREKVLQVGMNDHIAKPIEPDNLRQKILRFLSPVVVGISGFLAPDAGRCSRPSGSERKTHPIDVWGGIQRIGGNHERYFLLLRQFAEQVPATLEELKRAQEAQDAEKMHFSAHALKGVAANLGLPATARAAGEIARTLRHSPPHPDLHGAFLVLQQALTEDCQAIAAIIPGCPGIFRHITAAAPSSAASEVSPDPEMQVLLEQLRHDLEGHHFAAGKRLEHLQSRWGHRLHGLTEFRQLADACAAFQFQPALDALDKLLLALSSR